MVTDDPRLCDPAKAVDKFGGRRANASAGAVDADADLAIAIFRGDKSATMVPVPAPIVSSPVPPLSKLLSAVAFGLLLAGCLADGEAGPGADGSPAIATDAEAARADVEDADQREAGPDTDAGDAARVPDQPPDLMTPAAGETGPRTATPDRARRLILPPELLDEPENAPLRRLPPDVGIERAAIDGRLAIPDRLRVGPEVPAAGEGAHDGDGIAANPGAEALVDADRADGMGPGGADAIDDRAAVAAASPFRADDGDDAADSTPLLEPAATPGVQAWAPSQRVRQGPWHVVCYQDNQVVFEHDAIYRVWRADHNPPQWAYETIDGVRFRGRIGTDVNCTWHRL